MGITRRSLGGFSRLAFAIAIVTFSYSASAQNTIQFRHLSIDQGLSQSGIHFIMQDSQGFMWFATEDGVNRYDGREMRIFRPQRGNPRSISNNWVYCMLEDSDGKIWMGTDNGLNRFDPDSELFTRYFADPQVPAALPGNRISVIAEDEGKNLWIGTDKGLVLFGPEHKDFERIDLGGEKAEDAAPSDIRAILLDSGGAAWVGTAGDGLFFRGKRDSSWTRFTYHKAEANSLVSNSVSSILKDRTGAIWIGTHEGLDRLTPGTGEFVHFRHDDENPSSLSDNAVNCLFQDDSGDLWIGTNDRGLNLLDSEGGGFAKFVFNPSDPYGINDNRILSIFQDSSGLMWIGTYGGGLNMFQKGAFRFLHIQASQLDPMSISSNHVRSFLEDGPDRLFVGVESTGLNIMDRKAGKTFNYQNDPNDPSSISGNHVFSIIRDGTGAVWLGIMGGGIDLFDPASGTFKSFRHDPADPESLSSDRVRTIRASQRGGLWVGTDGGGVNYFDPLTGRFRRYLNRPDDANSIALDRIFSLNEDPKTGVLWIGTFGAGLDRFDPDTGAFTHFPAQAEDTKGMINNYVLCIHIDGAGILWIGTNGGGLTRFDPSGNTFASFGREDGMANTTVYGILEDEDGNLWLSSNQGIAKFNPRAQVFKNYDMSDGLQSMEFNGGSFYKGPSGWMYFGGVLGFNKFMPKDISDNPYIPPVVITHMQLFNRELQIGQSIDDRVILPRAVNLTDRIELSHSDRVISFEFAALSFFAPEKNQYAYMMEGFDKDWNLAGTRRFASYTNLPPKTYRFIVKASNNDGLWNETGTSLTIVIRPPFWKTWWFWTLVAITFALGIASAFTVRVRSIVAQKKKLEALVDQRTKELKEAYEEMEHLSITDALTGLYNRRYFTERVKKDIALVIRQHSRKTENKVIFDMGFFMIDLDFFKSINDTHGHDIGDLLLKEICRRFNESMRQSDILVRWGGEEFLLLSKENDFDGACTLANRLLKAVGDAPFNLKGQVINTSISIGFCAFPFIVDNPRAFTWEEVVKFADQALYIAKHTGRNRAVGIRLNEQKMSEEDINLLKKDFDEAKEAGIFEMVEIVSKRSSP